MKRSLKVFFAGKVSPDSHCVAPGWREELTWRLNSRLQKVQVVDSSLITARNRYVIAYELPIMALFSQSCFYIQHSDALVVNLTDDISVGGSQEIFIAKQAGIPVIGIAPRGGKFNRLKFELGGKIYWNWVHPFVEGLCDLVVQDVEELAAALEDIDTIPAAGLRSISGAINHYQNTAAALDTTVNRILGFEPVQRTTVKPRLRVYFAGKMGKAAGFSETAWRDAFAAALTRSSRFAAINLDFLEPSHAAVNESDGRLMFGRDAYLIRSSDVVVAHLSDDISVGGAVEMMLAKFFHRPLIAVARQNGKFVHENKDLFGRRVKSYVNPFVSATADWLVHDVSQLAGVVDGLFEGPIKTNAIIPAAGAWYEQRLYREDRAAQVVFAAR